MKRLIINFTVVALLCFFACNSDDLEITVSEKFDSVINMEDISEFHFEASDINNLIRDVEYVKLEKTIQSEIQFIYKVSSSNNLILVLNLNQDRLEALLFDRSGNFKFKIDYNNLDGGGALTDVHLSNKHLTVLDNINKLIYSFDLNGNLLKQYKIDREATNVSFDEISNRFILHSPFIQENASNSIHFFDSELYTGWGEAELDENYIIPVAERFHALPDGTVYYTPFSSSKVYKINPNLEIVGQIDINTQGSGEGLKLSYDYSSTSELNNYHLDQPINMLIGNEDYISIEKRTENGTFTIIYNKFNNEVYKIRHTTKLNDFGDDFNFVFRKFHGSFNAGFISYLPAIKFNQILDLAVDEEYSISEYFSHLPEVSNEDNPLLIFYSLK